MARVLGLPLDNLLRFEIDPASLSRIEAGPWGARALALCAGCSILAKAMTGHASGNADHETATTTMLVHLLAVGVWIGGLAVMQLLPGGDRDAAGVVRRL